MPVFCSNQTRHYTASDLESCSWRMEVFILFYLTLWLVSSWPKLSSLYFSIWLVCLGHTVSKCTVSSLRRCSTTLLDVACFNILVTSTWKMASLWSQTSLAQVRLLMGIVWRVGNEVQIRAWRDPWIPRELELRPITWQRKYRLRWVADFLNHDGTWIVQLLEHL